MCSSFSPPERRPLPRFQQVAEHVAAQDESAEHPSVEALPKCGVQEAHEEGQGKEGHGEHDGGGVADDEADEFRVEPEVNGLTLVKEWIYFVEGVPVEFVHPDFRVDFREQDLR